MHDYYEHLRIKIKPRSWAKVIQHINNDGAKQVKETGGVLYGFWTGQIGLPANEGIVLTCWPQENLPAKKVCPVIEGNENILEVYRERLAATVRPVEPIPLIREGIYAQRWFEIQEADWEEFLALSTGAWPAYEKSFDSEIIGFWRSLDVHPPKARVLLITRYPNLVVWEKSRKEYHTRDEVEAMKRFRRRQELTDWTMVVTTELRSGKTS